MKKKQILLFNYEGFQHPEWGVRTLWSDTWVCYKDRRRRVNLGPTIVSMGDVRREAEWHGEDWGKEDWHEKPVLPEGPWEFHLGYGENIECPGLPCIHANEDYLTTARIERAVEWYLREYKGVVAPMKFWWKKSQGGFIMPW